MSSRYEKIGSLVRRGVLLFAKAAPFPASALVAAVGAAVVSKTLELHENRITEVLSTELRLDHISYVEPDEKELLDFYRNNPLYPELSDQFANDDAQSLRRWYPYLYAALVLNRQIPILLFHQELEQKRYRELAEKFEVLSQGFNEVEGDPELEEKINHFAENLLEVLNEVYEAARDEIKDKRNEFAFDIVDYIREVATT